MSKRFLAAAAVAVGVTVGAPAGASADVACVGELTGVVSGNLVVPGGASCTLAGAHVTGHVKVDSGASLYARDATIGGSARCNECAYVDLFRSSVGQDLEVRGETQGSYIHENTIGRNLEITHSTGGEAAFEIVRNRIGGNLVFKQNSGTAVVAENTVSGRVHIVASGPSVEVTGNAAKKHIKCGGNRGQTGQCRK